MAAEISRSLPHGGPLAQRTDARRPRLAAVEAQSLCFLTAMGIVGAASAGSLFAAAYVLLMQPKTAAPPSAPSAVWAATTPAQTSTPGIAAGASSPLVQRPAPTPRRAGSLRVAAAPASSGVAAKAPAPVVERGAPIPSAGGLPRSAAGPTHAAEPRSVAARIALAQGEANFGGGQLSAAQFYYERAVDAGDAGAAVRMGETFDPAFLTYGRLRWVRGDPVAARFWYRRALGLGAAEAKQRLDYLDSEPAAVRDGGKVRSGKFRRGTATGPREDQPGSPPEPTFHQLLERILHPPMAADASDGNRSAGGNKDGR
jgi:hypothetical protein